MGTANISLASEKVRNWVGSPLAGSSWSWSTGSVGRVACLRTRALAVYACDALRGFMLEDTTQMLALAATVGCVDVLAELMDARGCAGPDPSGRVCDAAASHGRGRRR
jgi:hypothetical protein